MQQFSLRKHQLDAVQAAINKPHNGVLTAVIPPGGGKTILALAVLDAMRKAGKIDAAVVFTPRLGLCSQFELDWKSVRQHFQPGAMGAIVHRENESIDSLRGFGYITSYQSLCADPAVHLRFARRFKGRLAIVCDEAHYLGEQLYGNGETTQAAKILAQIGEYTAFKLVMTGTPYRSDENPIVFVDYDDEGKIKADVQISYSDGVAQGYLRPFDATLFDGSLSQTRRYQRDGVTRYRKEEIDLSSTAQQLTKVATDPHFWQIAARHAFEKVKELQELSPSYCGIAGCANQEHARQVLDYLQSLGARCLLAVSDDSQAHSNLRLFKSGGRDMLVTVGMAHVGYDHKPIAVAAVLNGVREFNWLDQFTMRAGRMLPGRPNNEQTAWIFGLNDLAMRNYVAAKRKEADRGIKTAEEVNEQPVEPVGSFGSDGPRLLYHGVTLDSITGIGFGYKTFSEELTAEDTQPITDKELREQLRRRRQGLVGQYAGSLYGQVNGETICKANGVLLHRYGKAVTACTVEELRVQIAWLEQTLGFAGKEEAPVEQKSDKDDRVAEFVQAGLFS